MTADPESLRLLEALLFASREPLDERTLADRLPAGGDPGPLLEELARQYAARGVNLVRVAGGWCFRTAPDLAERLVIEREEQRRLSRAAVETLAVIAYHQPVTRAEIEAIRGVAVARGTLDALLETGWIRPGPRRRVPGRPVTWLTAPAFLVHFGLENLEALPGIEELRAAGLMVPDDGDLLAPAEPEDVLGRGLVDEDDLAARELDRPLVPGEDDH